MQQKKIEEMKSQIVHKGEEYSEFRKIDIKIRESEPFAATVNSENCVEMIKRAAAQSGFDCEELPRPFPWSEDFGHFASLSDIALIGIGAGEDHPHLHSEMFDFEDELLPVAVQLFINTIKEEWKTQ